jgi:hypothetical protein
MTNNIDPKQIVCTGEEGTDVWNCAFGTWSEDDFGIDSDEAVGKGERLYVRRDLYDNAVNIAQDQWQPIETLPNNSGGQVIAWPVLQFRDHERTQVASCSVDFARMSGATHWMPLPEAPKDPT